MLLSKRVIPNLLSKEDKIKNEYLEDYAIGYYIDDKFKLSENSIHKQMKRVLELKDKPQPEQRTKEWFEFRNNRFGASEIASIFNKNPFCSMNKLILEYI